MRIAICDDNIADRKHLERLLARESDKRAGTPNILYVDSFGDKEHFLMNPLAYDLIFMDMASSPADAEEILYKLTIMESNIPLVLCSSTVDYTTFSNLPDTVIHRNKPYTAGLLPELLALGDTHIKNEVVKLAVPCPDRLHYIPKDDIMYCMPVQDGYVICLQDGSDMTLACDIREFQLLVLPHSEFYRSDKRHIINTRVLTRVTPLSVIMQDGKKFPISFLRFLELAEKRLWDRLLTLKN